MKRLSSFILLLGMLALACGRSGQPAGIPPPTQEIPATATVWDTAVPSEYQAIYDDLNAALDQFAASLPQSGGTPPTFAAELSYANGNVGEALLRPEMLPLVRAQLDALHAMGVKGVVVAIKFPMLEADFPHSAEYLHFFEQVAAEIRQRGMKILVEAGPLFSGTIYSSLSVDWSKYTQASFLAAQENELQTIAARIRPDYLQIANEPSTLAMLTGFQLTPAEYADFVRTSVEKIGHPGGMLLAAGSGTWEDPAYMNDLTGIPGLDCIDIHIYPIGRDGGLLQRAYATAGQARAAGKRVVISEAWLYKIRSSDLATFGGDYATVISRDAFSFFEPLDEKYIQVLTRLARAGGIEFVAFFWTRSFFAYLSYDQAHTLTEAEINRQMNAASVAALQSGATSPLGLFYQEWIAGQTP